jgi:hypothetical protein
MAQAEAEYITGKAATRILACTYTKLKGLVVRGVVEVKLEPGIAPQYRRQDVEAFATSKAALGALVRNRRIDHDIEHQPPRRPRPRHRSH